MNSIPASKANAANKAPSRIAGFDEITGGALPRGRTRSSVGGAGAGNRAPPAPRRPDFQARAARADQQRDQVDVLVGARSHVRNVRGGDWRVMDRAQDRIAEFRLIGEIVARQSDMQRQRRQHA